MFSVFFPFPVAKRWHGDTWMVSTSVTLFVFIDVTCDLQFKSVMRLSCALKINSFCLAISDDFQVIYLQPTDLKLQLNRIWHCREAQALSKWRNFNINKSTWQCIKGIIMVMRERECSKFNSISINPATISFFSIFYSMGSKIPSKSLLS